MNARRLARDLAATDDPSLGALFLARGIRPLVGWADFFDAADALLDPLSLAKAIDSLGLDDALALRAGRSTPALQQLGLVYTNGDPIPAAQQAASARPMPSLPPVTSVASADESATAHAAERAFTTVAYLADALLAIRDTPVALLSDGRLAAADRRTFVSFGIAEEMADPLLRLTASAGLTTSKDKRLRLTRAGDAWLHSDAIARWEWLATAFRNALPAALRTSTGGWLPATQWAGRYPWDSEWPAHEALLRTQAHALGLLADDGTAPPWALALSESGDVDTTALRALLPADVDKLFLQNDLTAIAPGHLRATIDVRLRRMAERESATQSSQYRFTTASLTRAFAAGESAESLTQFLEEISLTGIPQPLSYVIAQTASRHGLIRVSSDPQSRITLVSSDDDTLLRALAVDQRLRPLALSHSSRDGAAPLHSRVGRDTVFWALCEARYPATLVDENGQSIVPERELIAEHSGTEPADFGALIAALRGGHDDNTDAAWLGRELERAVRSRATVSVTVAMPDGSDRELTLEATGFGGGRLRGRDRAADVERTLPLSHIRGITVLDDSDDVAPPNATPSQ